MRPTLILMQEHRVIEQVLSCLEKMAERCEAGQPLDIESANQVIDFIRNFSDGCHHAKEEDLLFPLMERKGFSRERGPTGVMLHEHEQGRRLVRAMVAAISDCAAGNAEASRAFAEQARGFVALLREHIQKEDHCLFPLADQTFSAGDQEELDHSFGRVEKEKYGVDTHARYARLADELADRYQVAKTATSG
jgi:hemerythrin-like domain-containing protein